MISRKVKTILEGLEALSLDDLEYIHGVIDGMIEEKLEQAILDIDEIPCNDKREIIETSRRGSTTYRLEKVRCGKENCRCASGEKHGPYWYAYYRLNGKLHSEYIGKVLDSD